MNRERNVPNPYAGLQTALDLALSSKDVNNEGKHDFVGLHNIAKHIIHLKENSDAASLTINHLQEFHRELLKQPPQGQAAIPTLKMTSQMLAQKGVQFEVWKLRMTSMQQRMQNIINLVEPMNSARPWALLTDKQSFNVVIQHDSRILKNDSKSMNAIAMVTMAFLPLATIAVRRCLLLFNSSSRAEPILYNANNICRRFLARNSSTSIKKGETSQSQPTSGSSGL